MTDELARPFSLIEIKHLIFLHMKRDGMTYDEAKKKVNEVLTEVRVNHKAAKNILTQEKRISKGKKNFKEEFEKLTKRR